MSPHGKHRVKALVMSLAAMIGTAGAAGAVSAATDPGSPPADRVTSVSDLQAQTISVLARAQQAGDAIDTPLAGPYAANPELARQVDTAAGPVWVVPADGHICLRAIDSTDPVWACVSDSDAAGGRLMLSLRSAGDGLKAIYAVLPAGAVRPQLTTSSGADDVTSASGVIGQQRSDAQSLIFSDAGGGQHTIPLP
jgi:hypothetical protein